MGLDIGFPWLSLEINTKKFDKVNVKMSNIDNFVFMSICEVTSKVYSKTLYTNYASYCNGLLDSLRDGKLSKTQQWHVVAIYDELETIYAFSYEEANEYIIRFLESGRCEDFLRVVLETRHFFPITGD